MARDAGHRDGGGGAARGAAASPARGWRRRRVSRWPRSALLFGGDDGGLARRRAPTCCAGWAWRASRSRRRPLPTPTSGRGAGPRHADARRRPARAGRARARPAARSRTQPGVYATTPVRRHGRGLARLRRPDPRADLPGVGDAVHPEDGRATPTRSSEVTVDGKPGYFITGAHGFAFEPETDDVDYEDQRIAGNTLLVEGDGVLLRIEGAITKDRAVEIAESVQ